MCMVCGVCVCVVCVCLDDGLDGVQRILEDQVAPAVLQSVTRRSPGCQRDVTKGARRMLRGVPEGCCKGSVCCVWDAPLSNLLLCEALLHVNDLHLFQDGALTALPGSQQEHLYTPNCKTQEHLRATSNSHS